MLICTWVSWAPLTIDISCFYPPNSLHSLTELIIKLVCRLEMEAFKHRLSFGLNKRWSRWARSAILALPLHYFRDSLPHYLATGVGLGARSVAGDCVHWRKDLIRAAQCVWCGSCRCCRRKTEPLPAPPFSFAFKLHQPAPSHRLNYYFKASLIKKPEGLVASKLKKRCFNRVQGGLCVFLTAVTAQQWLWKESTR